MSEWHLISGEYPPQIGGVGDYTRLVAAELARVGEAVHVWCPAADDPGPQEAGVQVHREMGDISPGDLLRVGQLLDRFAPPRRLLVQWVPHSYGYQSMNLPLCFWLWKRGVFAGDRIELMVHEPFLAFRQGTWRQDAAALVHRLMTIVLLSAVRRVWISIPAWEQYLRPYTMGRRLTFNWLPVPSNVPVIADPAGVSIIRARYTRPGGLLVSHFGAYIHSVIEVLMSVLPALMDGLGNVSVLLLGHGSESACAELSQRRHDLAGRIHATGTLVAADLSRHLSASDVMIQPYPDGVSTRRGGVMAGISHGLPIVTTNGKLTESLWAESGAVATVPAGDTAALLAMTKQLLANDNDRRRLGDRASRLYQERFDVKHTVAALRHG